VKLGDLTTLAGASGATTLGAVGDAVQVAIQRGGAAAAGVARASVANRTARTFMPRP